MPLEGHAERLATPLRPRDRHVLVVAAALGAVGLAGGVYAYAGRSASPALPGGRCVTITLPSTMGGATVHECGSAAAALCRDAKVRLDPRLAADCRRGGF